MNKYLLSGLLFLTNYSFADDLIEFKSGSVAKASDFNNNFNLLSSKIDELSLVSGLPNALVNGKSMYVSLNNSGTLSIKSPTGVYALIGLDGNLANSPSAHYSSSNCSGDSYLQMSTPLTNEYADNFKFANPISILPSSIVGVDGVIKYPSNDITILHSKSYKLSGVCKTYNSSILAHKLLTNDPAVTGFDKLPLLVTGVGEVATINDVIGSSSGMPLVSYKVYANGVHIGNTTKLPDSDDNYVSNVSLNGYSETTISIYKDGSTSGFPNPKIHFLTSNCTGNGYIKVHGEHTKYWWDSTKAILETISYSGTTYALSEQVYKMSTGYQSYQYSSGSCSSSTGDTSGKDGYQKVGSQISSYQQTFTAPITVESWVSPSDEVNAIEAF